MSEKKPRYHRTIKTNAAGTKFLGRPHIENPERKLACELILSSIKAISELCKAGKQLDTSEKLQIEVEFLVNENWCHQLAEIDVYWCEEVVDNMLDHGYRWDGTKLALPIHPEEQYYAPPKPSRSVGRPRKQRPNLCGDDGTSGIDS